MRDVFDEYQADALNVAVWDEHPNAFAHKLFADRLFAMTIKGFFNENEPNQELVRE
jgi:hypothetical protein